MSSLGKRAEFLASSDEDGHVVKKKSSARLADIKAEKAEGLNNCRSDSVITSLFISVCTSRVLFSYQHLCNRFFDRSSSALCLST